MTAGVDFEKYALGHEMSNQQSETQRFLYATQTWIEKGVLCTGQPVSRKNETMVDICQRVVYSLEETFSHLANEDWHPCG